MKTHQPFGLVLAVFLFFSCQPKVAENPWQKFMECASNSCVKEAAAVKDAFLKDPVPLFEEFILTDARGEDTYIGWVYLLRDSILNNANYAPEAERTAMRDAIVAKAKEFEADPKYGDWAKSIIREVTGEQEATGELSVTGTYAFELADDLGSGEIKVLDNGDNTIRFDLMVVGPPPAHNQGYMEGNAPLNGNVATISTTEYGDKCEITLTFSDGKLEVKTVAGTSPDCGFGHNVMADGTYELVNDINPFQSVEGDEAPSDLEGTWVSQEDAKFVVAIEAGTYTEIYDGDPGPSFPFSFHKACPQDCNPIAETPCIRLAGQDVVCYTLVKLDAKSLELSMIGGRGNTLVFKRKE